MTNQASRDKRSDVALAVSTAAVFIAVAMVFNLEYALEAAVTFAVFSAIIQQKWDLRKKAWFWVTIGLFFAIHLILAVLIEIPDVRPGIITVPIAIIDGLCMLAVINWMQRRSAASL